MSLPIVLTAYVFGIPFLKLAYLCSNICFSTHNMFTSCIFRPSIFWIFSINTIDSKHRGFSTENVLKNVSKFLSFAKGLFFKTKILVYFTPQTL